MLSGQVLSSQSSTAVGGLNGAPSPPASDDDFVSTGASLWHQTLRIKLDKLEGCRSRRAESDNAGDAHVSSSHVASWQRVRCKLAVEVSRTSSDGATSKEYLCRISRMVFLDLTNESGRRSCKLVSGPFDVPLRGLVDELITDGNPNFDICVQISAADQPDLKKALSFLHKDYDVKNHFYGKTLSISAKYSTCTSQALSTIVMPAEVHASGGSEPTNFSIHLTTEWVKNLDNQNAEKASGISAKSVTLGSASTATNRLQTMTSDAGAYVTSSVINPSPDLGNTSATRRPATIHDFEDIRTSGVDLFRTPPVISNENMTPGISSAKQQPIDYHLGGEASWLTKSTDTAISTLYSQLNSLGKRLEMETLEGHETWAQNVVELVKKNLTQSIMRDSSGIDVERVYSAALSATTAVLSDQKLSDRISAHHKVLSSYPDQPGDSASLCTEMRICRYRGIKMLESAVRHHSKGVRGPKCELSESEQDMLGFQDDVVTMASHLEDALFRCCEAKGTQFYLSAIRGVAMHLAKHQNLMGKIRCQILDHIEAGKVTSADLTELFSWWALEFLDLEEPTSKPFEGGEYCTFESAHDTDHATAIAMVTGSRPNTVSRYSQIEELEVRHGRRSSLEDASNASENNNMQASLGSGKSKTGMAPKVFRHLQGEKYGSSSHNEENRSSKRRKLSSTNSPHDNSGRISGIPSFFNPTERARNRMSLPPESADTRDQSLADSSFKAFDQQVSPKSALRSIKGQTLGLKDPNPLNPRPNKVAHHHSSLHISNEPRISSVDSRSNGKRFVTQGGDDRRILRNRKTVPINGYESPNSCSLTPANEKQFSGGRRTRKLQQTQLNQHTAGNASSLDDNALTSSRSRLHKKWPVPAAPPGVIFFRSVSKRPLEEGELLSNSDDECSSMSEDGGDANTGVATATRAGDREFWLQLKHNAALDEIEDVTPAERKFLKHYDAFFRRRRVNAKKHVPKALLDFVRQESVWLLTDMDMERELFKKCASLVTNGSLKASDVMECRMILKKASELVYSGEFQASNEGDEERSTLLEWRRKRACWCGQSPAGDMRGLVSCADFTCTQPLFHLQCVGLNTRPAHWLCQNCRERTKP